MPRQFPIRKRRRRRRASGPNGSRTSPWSSTPNARIPQEMSGWLAGKQRHAFPEYLAAPAPRPQGPEQVRLRHGARVLRRGCRPVGAADRRPDRPPPRPSRDGNSGRAWIIFSGPSQRRTQRIGRMIALGTLSFQPRLPRTRPTPLSHRARPLRPGRSQQSIMPTRHQSPTPRLLKRCCASGSRKRWASRSCAS